jgi:3-(3-hydroxy-phenyl)propionate hydroxylase
VTLEVKPVLIVGAGPVGLTTALACRFYGIPFKLFEEDEGFSSDTKAGTLLTRTLEAFRRYGIAQQVLAKALRVDEIGDIERATNKRRKSVLTSVLASDTRFPFVVNLPQHHLEPILASGLEDTPPGTMNLSHKLTGFEQKQDSVWVSFETPQGPKTFEGSHLLACDGGRSTVRGLLDIPVEGVSLDVRYMLVDIKVDLDVHNPRDYPYLSYFSDPKEWMVLVRQPHCWRFLFPLAAGAQQATAEQLAEKARLFIGNVGQLEVLNTVIYNVHHRIASKWRDGRVFLLGDAAHLITPMWALGLNTGILDAINLPWRLAWVLRGWASDTLLDGYSAEQHPLALHGSGEMAEAARALMGGANSTITAMSGEAFDVAMTRTMLGVRLDVEGGGNCSIVKSGKTAVSVGDRIPDMDVFDGSGRVRRVHELVDDTFAALHFVDVRKRPVIPTVAPSGLSHFVVSRWDAPLDSGLRNQAILDIGDQFRQRLGLEADSIVLVRPDDHIAAILPAGGPVVDVYRRITGQTTTCAR